MTHRNALILSTVSLAAALGATSRADAQLVPSFDIERAPVAFVQVEVKTCDVTNGGTDDDMYVQLTSASDERVYLNNGKDDARRGAVDSHGFVLPVVGKVRDITRFEIGRVGGSDGWCIQSVALKVNGQTMFDREVNQWVDADGEYPSRVLFNTATLRADDKWTSQRSGGAVCRLPTFHSATTIRDLAEGTLGHMMLERSNGELPGLSVSGADKLEKYLKWGHMDGEHYVEFDAETSSRFNIDYDLEASVATTPEVDLDVDIVLGCTNGKFTATAQSPHVAASWDGFFGFLGNWLLGFLNEAVNDVIGGVSFDYTVALDPAVVPQSVKDRIRATFPGVNPDTFLRQVACPAISVSDAGVSYDWGPTAIETAPILCAR